MLIDSHCHLNYEPLVNNLEVVLSNAKAAGVDYLLTVNTDLDSTALLAKIANDYPQVFYSVGVHPHEAEKYLCNTLGATLCDLASPIKAIALGETGLDFYYNHSPKIAQIESFAIHLEAAKKLKLPVIIHTREADVDTLGVIDDCDYNCGVFHCFSGDYKLAKAALDRGYYISFSGIITFEKALELQNVAAKLPLERILIETDSPYLAPTPHRGKKNEPQWVRLVAEKLALIKEISFEEVASATTQNFKKLFAKAGLD